jgi:hypothetical protein
MRRSIRTPDRVQDYAALRLASGVKRAVPAATRLVDVVVLEQLTPAHRDRGRQGRGPGLTRNAQLLAIFLGRNPLGLPESALARLRRSATREQWDHQQNCQCP